jgi:hypothetical protein
VAADVGFGETIPVKAHLNDRIFDNSVDLSGGYLLGVMMGKIIVGADSCVGILGVLHDVGDSSCKGSDWAGGKTSAVMMDALATLAILLIGNAEGCMGSSVEL